MADPVVKHVRSLLEAAEGADAALHEQIRRLEADGYRIVSGGQAGLQTWDVIDWRTGEMIAEGDGGLGGYDAACSRLDPAGTWLHIDHLETEQAEQAIATTTPGVPHSLTRALDDWISSSATPDQEIAEFVGWPEERVHACR